MARLAALLLLVLSLTPARSVPWDLARAGSGAEIGVAVAAHEIAPPEAPSRLLIGGGVGGSEAASGDQPTSAERLGACLPLSSAALAGAPPRPVPQNCSPHSQRLPYHATAPPRLG